MFQHILTNTEIPIIEPSGGGHWEIYKDAEDKIVKKVWHKTKINYRDVPSDKNNYINEKLNNMVNSTLKSFQDKKRAESSFITLADDGDEVSGIVKEIKQLSKVGFSGQEMEVIRLILETENGIKSFDRGVKSWVDELIAKEVDIGSKITIIRHGEKESKKTTYEIQVQK